MDDNVDMVTVAEWAGLRGCSKVWALKLAVAGRIEGALKAGPCWVVPREAGMPDRLKPGPKPDMSSSRVRQAIERAAVREEKARVVVVPKRAPVREVVDEYKRERDRWWNDMLGMDIEPVGGRWAGIDGAVVGVGWAVGESAKQFEARLEEWRVWKEAGMPDEGMPADYREWLGDSNNQSK